MRGIEQIAWLYDASMWLLERGGLGRWRAWLAAGARGRVLDLGCGTGRNLSRLPRGAVGVDPAHGLLLAARRRAPGALLVRARAEALPFRDGAFDAATCGLVLCSVDHPPGALAELRRVLAPGAEVRLLEHVRASGRAAAWLQDAGQPAWTAITGGCRPNRDTEAALAAAGFELLERRARGAMRRLRAVARRSRELGPPRGHAELRG